MLKKSKYSKTIFSCYTGAIVQAVTNSLPPLLFVIFCDLYGISYSKISILLVVNYTSQLLTDITAARLGKVLNFRFLATLSQVLSFVGLSVLSIFPHIMEPFAGLFAATVLYSVGSGLAEVTMSPIINAIPDEKNSLSLLHSFFCWGTALTVGVSTLLIKLIGTQLWYLLPAFWAVIPLYNTISFTLVPMPDMPDDDGGRGGIKALFKTPSFYLAGILMVCGGASELAASQWASLFAENGLGVDKMTGDLMGPFCFALFMGTGRVLLSRYENRTRIDKLLFISSCACALCYLGMAFLSPVFALAACALTGLTVAILWPGTLTYSARRVSGSVTMFALLAFFGDVGCTAGPALTGLVADMAAENVNIASFGASFGLTADQTGLRAGLLVCVIFPLVSAVASFIAVVSHNKNLKKATDRE